MRQGSRDREATAEDLLAHEFRHWREKRGLSRDELAQLVGYSRHSICQLEQPSRPLPPRPLVERVDRALDAAGTLIELREAAIAARRERLRRGPDPELDSTRRVTALLNHRGGDRQLDALDRAVTRILATADDIAKADVVTSIMAQQRYVETLMTGRMLPRQTRRLYMLAGHLAAMLAVALLDMDQVRAATASCIEAVFITEAAGDEGLRALTLKVHQLVEAAARESEPPPAEPSPQRSRNGSATTPGGHPEVRRQTRGQRPTQHGSWATTGAGDLTGELGADSPDEAAANLFPDVNLPDVNADALADAAAAGVGEREQIAAPGAASTARLSAMIQERAGRYTTLSVARARPPAGLSSAFRPPI
jgi:DNA-binding XRE family transcriptional regulator